jgi:tRNA modification GTPase
VSSLATIAAIATAPGESALAVIRISGPGAFSIARGLGALGHEVRTHVARVRTLKVGTDLLDQALVLPFAGPRSFTGEDVVELHVHGGRVTPQRVLDAVFAGGALPAEPGEFSRRALINGKLDLVQVEAIADVIHARSVSAQRLAQAHLAGSLSAEIDRLKAALFLVVTLVEAAIDFSSEEHVYSISAEEIIEGVQPVVTGVERLLSTYDAGRLRQEGVTVALIGRPNAGKSSLLNRFLREDRAIVTEIAGTTRDTIQETIALHGVHYHLIDTAGLRESSDAVEALGVERSKRALESCDIALVVVAADDEAGPAELIELADKRPTGVVVNKVDLDCDPSWAGALDCRVACVSLTAGTGLEALEPLLEGLAQDAGLGAPAETMLLTRERHRELLRSVRDDLARAIDAAEMDVGHELVAFDLRAGLQGLGGLTGSITDDDILNRIFGDFCVGK